MAFKLLALGGLRLADDDGTVSGPAAQRRRLALLALLAVAGERALTREKAVGYLWPEQPAARARHLLSEALYVLRKLLGDDAVVAGADDIRLNGDVVWCDVVAFRKALRDDPAAAVELYHGPFLDGFYLSDAQEFEQWAEEMRAQCASDYGRALEMVAHAAVQRDDLVGTAQLWAKRAYHEPLSARVALRYMEALAAAGDRARAIQYANVFAERQRDELGIEPDAAVVELCDRLQRSSGTSEAVAVPAVVIEEAVDVGLDELRGDLDVIRSVGVGSVAEVFVARENALKRLVAVKVLLPQFAADDNARRRFEREAQAAARIEHPNVAAAFRFGRLSNGVPYLVMPYINGGSLEDRLAATGPWDSAQSRKQLAQIASGLAAAHRLGIVHRDVRPANILYHRDSDRVLLTDFGVAAVLESGDAEQMRLTRPGEQLGNIAYASPEQLRAEQVTERADVYSLGVIAFEMLAGELPFNAKTHAQMLLAHATEPPRLVSDVVSDVDRRIGLLVGKCLNKRAEQRPYAAEVAEAMAG